MSSSDSHINNNRPFEQPSNPTFYTTTTDSLLTKTVKAAYMLTPFAGLFPPDGLEEESLREMYERGSISKATYEKELKITKMVKSHVLHNHSLTTILWHTLTNTQPESAFHYRCRITNI